MGRGGRKDKVTEECRSVRAGVRVCHGESEGGSGSWG